MFARTRDEGERRLTRSRLELMTTSFVAGFDIVFGVIALAAATAAMTPHFGPEAGHFFGSLFFGIAFIFIVVGRSELFTENFLVPLTAMRRGKLTKLKLAELWTISPILNIAGGTVLILIVSTQGVLPEGAPHAVNEAATHIDDLSLWSAFMSAIVGGALITAMTWMVEGVGTVGGRIVVAWVAGVILALASLNHVIVVTLELIFGMRYGADIAVGEVVRELRHRRRRQHDRRHRLRHADADEPGDRVGRDRLADAVGRPPARDPGPLRRAAYDREDGARAPRGDRRGRRAPRAPGPAADGAAAAGALGRGRHVRRRGRRGRVEPRREPGSARPAA